MTIEAVVLAAGLSSRANAYKMALDVAGTPVLVRTILPLLSVCQKVFVVTGYRADVIEQIIADSSISNKYKGKLILVHNANYQQGMFSSVKAGCHQITADQFFLTPGDYPLLQQDTIEKLLEISADVVIPSYQKKAGHPIKISKNIIKSITAAADTSNLRSILKDFNKKYVNVTDRGVISDLDTQADYQYILGKV